jgi:hypothetical protein
LQSERDSLKYETEQLRYKRDQYIEEAQKLNEKNLELAELNNDLMKQIESNHKSKNQHFAFFKNYKIPHGHHQTDPSSKISGHIKSPSLYNIETDSLEGDSLQKVARRNSIGRGVTAKKFNWKKGGKVLNKLLANATVAVNGVPSNISMPTISNENRMEANKRMYSQMLENYAMNRTHNWQQFNLTSPVKCDHCHEKMGGVAELKCSGIFLVFVLFFFFLF